MVSCLGCYSLSNIRLALDDTTRHAGQDAGHAAQLPAGLGPELAPPVSPDIGSGLEGALQNAALVPSDRGRLALGSDGRRRHLSESEKGEVLLEGWALYDICFHQMHLCSGSLVI